MKKKIMILLPTGTSDEQHNNKFWETEIFKRFQKIEHDTQKIGILITVQNSDYKVMDITIDEENIKKVGSELEIDNKTCIIMLRHFASGLYQENKHSSDVLTQIIKDKCNLKLLHLITGSLEQFSNYKDKLDTYIEFSRSEPRNYWPNFKNLIDLFLEGGRIKSEADLEEALLPLIGISEEKLLISMKILFLPAYLASKSNKSNVFIDKDDLEQLTNIKTTKDGEEFREEWLLGHNDGTGYTGSGRIGQYFEEDEKDGALNGALKKDKKEDFCNAYKDFCKIDHIPNA